MPVLHLVIKNSRQNISIPTDLTAQDLTLVESSITLRHHQTVSSAGVKIEMPFISPLDFVSSEDSRFLVLPRNFNDGVHTNGDLVCLIERHNLHFATEHIPSNFTIRTKNINDNSEPSFGTTNGDIDRIDLYFHYNHLERHL
jgi:hypothetical protein